MLIFFLTRTTIVKFVLFFNAYHRYTQLLCRITNYSVQVGNALGSYPVHHYCHVKLFYLGQRQTLIRWRVGYFGRGRVSVIKIMNELR